MFIATVFKLEENRSVFQQINGSKESMVHAHNEIFLLHPPEIREHISVVHGAPDMFLVAAIKN